MMVKTMFVDGLSRGRTVTRLKMRQAWQILSTSNEPFNAFPHLKYIKLVSTDHEIDLSDLSQEIGRNPGCDCTSACSLHDVPFMLE